MPQIAPPAVASIPVPAPAPATAAPPPLEPRQRADTWGNKHLGYATLLEKGPLGIGVRDGAQYPLWLPSFSQHIRHLPDAATFGDALRAVHELRSKTNLRSMPLEHVLLEREGNFYAGEATNIIKPATDHGIFGRWGGKKRDRTIDHPRVRDVRVEKAHEDLRAVVGAKAVVDVRPVHAGGEARYTPIQELLAAEA